MKNIIDDGFNAELVETAFFDGALEMPRIERPDLILIPPAVIPFSKRNRSKDFSECLVFYEHDINFADVLRTPDAYLSDVLRFPYMTALDCSVYRDMPLLAQMANVYRSRAIGHYYQAKGAYVIPNVRWGDERSYTTEVLPEKFAFLGVPKHSIVSIGTYGCLQSRENKLHFRQGLEAMLAELSPEVVMVYGAMPDSVFGGLYEKTQFIHYADWISQKRRRVA